MSKEHVGYLLTWTEFERGWGCRPDGATLHASQEEVKKFIKNFWKDKPKIAPDEYTQNDSDEGRLVKITPVLSKRLEKNKSFWLSREEEKQVRELNGE